MRRNNLNRRQFLGRAAFGAVALGVGFRSRAVAADGFPGMIVREANPLNLEFPFSSLDGFLTPNERFYVRNHFPIPEIDAADFRLTVEGQVGSKLVLSISELRELGERKLPALLECAGNGRVFLDPSVSGLQWGFGAVGCAEWVGVPLRAVLEKAGVKDSTTEVIFEGADRGPVTKDPKSPGPISFSRSLSVDKAMADEVLLAWGMNGADLPPSHGFPLRLVVPGWYGMASVKWLSRIVLTDRPFNGYWQGYSYTYYDRLNGIPTVERVGELLVKASIARPAMGTDVPANKPYRVHGAAWAGDAGLKVVEISTDGGKSWARAKLLDDAVKYCWRLWEYDWTPTRRGPAKLLARATDAAGNTQPMERDRDRRSYMINHVIPVEVTVR